MDSIHKWVIFFYISDPEPTVPSVGYKKPRQNFTDKRETDLEQYIESASKLYYAHFTKEVKTSAYQYAIRNQIKILVGWSECESASSDWLPAFLKRETVPLKTCLLMKMTALRIQKTI